MGGKRGKKSYLWHLATSKAYRWGLEVQELPGNRYLVRHFLDPDGTAIRVDSLSEILRLSEMIQWVVREEKRMWEEGKI